MASRGQNFPALRRRVRNARTPAERALARRLMSRPLEFRLPAPLLLLLPALIFAAGTHDVDGVAAFLMFYGTAASVCIAGWMRTRLYSRDIGALAYQPLADRVYFTRQVNRVIGLSAGILLLGFCWSGWSCHDLLMPFHLHVPRGGHVVADAFDVVPILIAVFGMAWGAGIIGALALYAADKRLANPIAGGVLLTLSVVVPLIHGSIHLSPVFALLPSAWPVLLMKPQILGLHDFYSWWGPILTLAGALLGTTFLRAARAKFHVRELQLRTSSDPAPGVTKAFVDGPETDDVLPPAQTLEQAAEASRERRRRLQTLLEPRVQGMWRAEVRRHAAGLGGGFIERAVEEALTPQHRAALVFLCGGSPGWTALWWKSAIIALAAPMLLLVSYYVPPGTSEVSEVARVLAAYCGVAGALASFALCVVAPGWKALSDSSGRGGMAFHAPYPLDLRLIAKVAGKTAWIRAFFWLPLCVAQAIPLGAFVGVSGYDALCVSLRLWLFVMALAMVPGLGVSLLNGGRNAQDFGRLALLGILVVAQIVAFSRIMLSWEDVVPGLLLAWLSGAAITMCCNALDRTIDYVHPVTYDYGT